MGNKKMDGIIIIDLEKALKIYGKANTPVCGTCYSRPHWEFPGEECMDYIIDIIHMSGFDVKANGDVRYVVYALRDLYKYYPALSDRIRSKDVISAYLREIDAERLKALAMHKYLTLSIPSAISIFMEDIYVEKANVTHKRIVSGSSIVTA